MEDYAAFGIVVDLANKGNTLLERLMASPVIMVKEIVPPDEINPDRPPLYKFPGGTSDRADYVSGADRICTARATVAREIEEEIGLAPSDIQFSNELVFHTEQFVPGRGDRMSHTRHFFMGVLMNPLLSVPQIGEDEGDREYFVQTGITVSEAVGVRSTELLLHHMSALKEILRQVAEYEKAKKVA